MKVLHESEDSTHLEKYKSMFDSSGDKPSQKSAQCVNEQKRRRTRTVAEKSKHSIAQSSNHLTRGESMREKILRNNCLIVT